MPNPNPPVAITVFWNTTTNSPDAANTTVRGKLNSATTVTWVCGAGVASIDGFNFTGNPQGSITPPAQRNGVWTAVDTVKGNDTLKYLVQATSSGGVQQWSADPVIQNEIEP